MKRLQCKSANPAILVENVPTVSKCVEFKVREITTIRKILHFGGVVAISLGPIILAIMRLDD